MSTDLLSQSEFMTETGLNSRRLIYLCEKGVIRPEVEAGGRGRARKFSRDNVAEFRLAETLLTFGFESRMVASVIMLVRSFFARLKTYKNPPKDLPMGLTQVSKTKPAWLVILDNSVVALRFRVDGRLDYTPYVKALPSGEITGLYDWDDAVSETSLVRIEIDLSRLPN